MARIKYKEAIGLEVKRGRPAIAKQPKKKDLARLYIQEGKSIRDTASALRCSKDIVSRALKKYRIKARSKARRSELLKYPLSDLKAAVRDKGIRGTARDLGVDEGTLRHHMKWRKGQ